MALCKAKGGGEGEEPVSPTGQYFNSSALSICILAVLESEIPIDDSTALPLLNNVFLPINPRFSSIMVKDKDGGKRWKRVEVKLKDHIQVPIFPSAESYDTYINDYLSKISMKQFPENRPLWEIHIIKYPTKHAAGTLVFKLHHALGDGFSLMGALLSCLQRADNPSLSLTFPSLQSTTPTIPHQDTSILCKVPKMFSSAFNTVSDFGWSVLKSVFVEDDPTPIRSGTSGVEFKPVTILTLTFSLDRIKQIKAKLGVTINDVIAGIIFLGTRLYMQSADPSNFNKLKTTSHQHSTALVLLNTRIINGGYKSVKEMTKPQADSPWGNQFGFIHVSIPHLHSLHKPLDFIFQARKLIQTKRNSLAVNLTGQLLELLRKFRGPESTARYIHKTLKNSSMTISNMIGPQEQMALANHPIKGLYFMVVGVPQSLTITMVSYVGNLRVAVGTEKGFIDPHKFNASIENSFDLIYEAANEVN